MICRYVYSECNGGKQLVGCVVRTDEGRLGYSAVHPRDRRKLTKKLARKIALGRAEKCEVAYNGGSVAPVWFRGRGEAWHVVPARVVPHLAALASLGPKGDV